MKVKINQVVILAGGAGARLGKLTKNKPKPLLKFKKKPFLVYLIEELKKINIDKIIILAGFKGDKINKKFLNNKNIKVIVEKKPLGTGGSLINAKKYLNNYFLLLNGDSFANINFKKKLLDFQNQKSKNSKIFLIENKNYKSNKLLSNLSINKNKKVILSKRNFFMYSGIGIINKIILEKFKNKFLSLEKDIFPRLINNKKLDGEIINTQFIDIGTYKNYYFAQKNIKNIFKRKCVFFDRDNTLIIDKGYTHKTGDLKWVNGAVRAIKYLNEKNFLVIVITNQSGVAKGYYSEEDVKTFHNHMNKILINNDAIIDDFSYCPYHPEGYGIYKKDSNFRKPGNLMLKEAIKKWNIDIKKSFFIGDSNKDEMAAKKTGLDFFYTNKKKNLFNLTKNILKKYESKRKIL